VLPQFPDAQTVVDSDAVRHEVPSLKTEREQHSSTVGVGKQVEKKQALPIIEKHDSPGIINHDVAPAKMTVRIQTDPRAWVVLNGDSLGITPVTVELDTSVENYQVAFICPGFPVIEKTLRTTALVNDDWLVSLWQEVGYFQVNVQPWGEIWIDGDSVDVTPLLQPLRLIQGVHSVTIRHPQLPARMETVRITAGDTLQRQYSLVR
jgi:hypothetical protein